MQISYIETRNLNFAIGILLTGYTRRTPAIAVNSAALVVARFTWANTPVTEQSRIDTDLQVEVTPILAISGKRKGMPLKNGATEIAVPERSMAAMIVLARMHPFSTYSIRTGNNWPLERPVYDKGGRDNISRFWGWVKTTAERMVRARHSSTGFLKSCWIPAIRDLEPYASASITKQRGAGPPTNSKYVPESGWAEPAAADINPAVCRIVNACGATGTGNMALNQKHNDALWLYDEGVLQQAIDDEAMNIMKLCAEMELRRDARRLAACGVRVN